jgi:phosphatidylserine decarboxylase
MSARLRIAVSHVTGWLADRRIPVFLRGPVYRAYAHLTGAELSEARPPLEAYPSLSAFFVRRLIDGARPVTDEPGVFASPVDGTLQALDRVHEGSLMQAKGRLYGVRGLLAGLGNDIDLDGAWGWTIYLSPRDYHRIHAPDDCQLVHVHWIPGDRHSVQPKVLARRSVLAVNERCALQFDCPRGPFFMVLVGALNVGRIRVLGVDPEARGDIPRPRPFRRGEELARFEMGSTVILIAPPGKASPLEGMTVGDTVRMGQTLGQWS